MSAIKKSDYCGSFHRVGFGFRSDQKGVFRRMSNYKKLLQTGELLMSAAASGVERGVNLLFKQVEDKIEERKTLVEVPALYVKGFPVSIKQAKKLLEKKQLKCSFIKLPLSEADGKYRNCVASQVIKTEPKAKEKVEPGTHVLVKYITRDVIEESKRLFEEERSKRQEKAKQVMTDLKKHIPKLVSKKDSGDET